MQLAEIGHNKPPSEMEILQQRLEENYIEEAMEYRRLAEKEIPETVEDEQSAGKLTDHIKAIGGLKRKITDVHKKEKSIYLECGRVVDGWKTTYESNLAKLIEKASAPLQIFLNKKAEEERQRQLEIAKKAREEADKLAAEALAHSQEGIEDTANDLMDAALQSEQKAFMIQSSALEVKGRARSISGASASQKFVTVGEIESLAAIDLEALRKYFTEDSIQKALNAAVRDGVREIRGAKIYQKTQLAVR